MYESISKSVKVIIPNRQYTLRSMMHLLKCASGVRKLEVQSTENKMIKLKHLKVGQEIKFEVKSPAREAPIRMQGKIGAISPIFGGHIHIEKGAVCEDEFIIRLECVK